MSASGIASYTGMVSTPVPAGTSGILLCSFKSINKPHKPLYLSRAMLPVNLLTFFFAPQMAIPK